MRKGTYRDKQIFARIQKKSMQSCCKFRVGAMGFNKDGKCIMTRVNRPRFDREGGGLHAEALIMAEALKKGIVRILICRIAGSGSFKPIDPCSRCKMIADKLGILIETVVNPNGYTERGEACKTSDKNVTR